MEKAVSTMRGWDHIKEIKPEIKCIVLSADGTTIEGDMTDSSM